MAGIWDVITSGAKLAATGAAVAGAKAGQSANKSGYNRFSVLEKAKNTFSTAVIPHLWDVILMPPAPIGGDAGSGILDSFRTGFDIGTNILQTYVTADWLPGTVQSRILEIDVPFYNIETEDIPQLGLKLPVVTGFSASEGFGIKIADSETNPTTLGYLMNWFKRMVNENGTVNERVYYIGKAYIILKSTRDYVFNGASPVALPIKIFYLQGVFPIISSKLMSLSQKADQILTYDMTFKYSHVTVIDVVDQMKSVISAIGIGKNLLSGGDNTSAASQLLAFEIPEKV